MNKTILHAAMIPLFCLVLVNPATADFKNWLLETTLATESSASSNITTVEQDDSAQRCLSCHNGAYATHITVKNANSPMQIKGFMTVNHSIGMYYDKYVSRKPNDYRSRAMLDPEIQFVNGQVSCVSCHQLKERQASLHLPSSARLMKVSLNSSKADSCLASNHLATGPRQTDLCMSCHIK